MIISLSNTAVAYVRYSTGRTVVVWWRLNSGALSAGTRACLVVIAFFTACPYSPLLAPTPRTSSVSLSARWCMMMRLNITLKHNLAVRCRMLVYSKQNV